MSREYCLHAKLRCISWKNFGTLPKQGKRPNAGIAVNEALQRLHEAACLCKHTPRVRPTSLVSYQGCHGADPDDRSSARTPSMATLVLGLIVFAPNTYTFPPPVGDIEEQVPTSLLLWRQSDGRRQIRVFHHPLLELNMPPPISVVELSCRDLLKYISRMLVEYS